MTMAMLDLLVEVDMPDDIRSRIGVLLSECGFKQAIDVAMLDDDLITSIAGTDNGDLRPFLAHLWTSARPLVDGWAKGVTKFGLGSRVEGGGRAGRTYLVRPPPQSSRTVPVRLLRRYRWEWSRLKARRAMPVPPGSSGGLRRKHS